MALNSTRVKASARMHKPIKTRTGAQKERKPKAEICELMRKGKIIDVRALALANKQVTRKDLYMKGQRQEGQNRRRAHNSTISETMANSKIQQDGSARMIRKVEISSNLKIRKSCGAEIKRTTSDADKENAYGWQWELTNQASNSPYKGRKHIGLQVSCINEWGDSREIGMTSDSVLDN